jgi:hypothetical protein
MNALRPAKVRSPPITQRNSDTPTDPVFAKIPLGVEKIPVPIILFKITNTLDVIPSLRESSNWYVSSSCTLPSAAESYGPS